MAISAATGSRAHARLRPDLQIGLPGTSVKGPAERAGRARVAAPVRPAVPIAHAVVATGISIPATVASVLRSIVLGEPQAAEKITAASDWFQSLATTTQIVS